VELGPHRCAGRLDFGCVYPDGRSVRSRPLVGNGEEDGPTPIKRMRSHFIGKLAGRHDRILAKTKRAMRGGNGAVDPSSRRAKLSDGLHTLFEVVLYHSDGLWTDTNDLRQLPCGVPAIARATLGARRRITSSELRLFRISDRKADYRWLTRA
jgi:hypothetical protein